MKSLLYLLTILTLTPTHSHSQSLPSTDFNFWVGQWDVYKYGTDTLVGKSLITSILDGHGILEEYSSVKYPYKGTSLNKYNTTEARWEQYYIDNSGTTLHLTGHFEDGKMILSNFMNDPASPTGHSYNKIVWEANDEGQVRQRWFQKPTEEDEWNTIFDGIYKKRE